MIALTDVERAWVERQLEHAPPLTPMVATRIARLLADDRHHEHAQRAHMVVVTDA